MHWSHDSALDVPLPGKLPDEHTCEFCQVVHFRDIWEAVCLDWLKDGNGKVLWQIYICTSCYWQAPEWVKRLLSPESP